MNPAPGQTRAIPAEDVDVLLTALRGGRALTPKEREDAEAIVSTHKHVVELLEQGATSVRGLKKLLGIKNKTREGNTRGKGSASNKTSKGAKPSSDGETKAGEPKAGSPEAPPPSPDPDANAGSSDAEAPPQDPGDTPKNRNEHGRRGWNDFPDAPLQCHAHDELKPGCQCPQCVRGRLYPCEPARIAVIVGRPPLQAERHEAERLQCNLCKTIFTASLGRESEDDGVDGRRLYAFSAATAVVLQKYYGGMPWHRQEGLQAAQGVEVPDASMSDLCERVANDAAPIARVLRGRARDAKLLLGDDTGALILAERAVERPDRRTGKLVERTGGHVTCVIAVTEDDHRITLYRVGIQHTGEMLDQVLEGRPPELPPPLFMGDCHSANTVTVCQVIYGACNAHAVRRFKALKDRYPEQAAYALERYKKIFDHETSCKEAKLNPQERLTYHREHSKPLLDELCGYGDELLESKAFEPNSDIAEAYGYVTNNRVRLSAFLRHPGMPLENNEVERKLRLPVRLRDNAPFFKNNVGAAWAETIWTVGDTALDHGVNLFDYFNAIQRHAGDVRLNPHLWLPWVYQERLAFLRQVEQQPQADAADHVTPRGASIPPERPGSNLQQPAAPAIGGRPEVRRAHPHHSASVESAL
jgi:transposase